LLLRPRRTIYKNFQKQRSIKTFKNKTFFHKNSTNKLVYGQFGLKNKNSDFYLYNKYLFKIKLFLKKSVRRSNITDRHLWVKVFPHIPITKKVIGSRMGKGKGKPANWAAKIPSEAIFMELRNVRAGRFKHFFKQVIFKLPGKYLLVSKFLHRTSLIAYRSKYLQYDYFF